LDFIAAFKPSLRAASSGEALAANRALEVCSCLDELEAVMVLLIANIVILMQVSSVKSVKRSRYGEFPFGRIFRSERSDNYVIE
jgi:hypothetical protein